MTCSVNLRGSSFHDTCKSSHYSVQFGCVNYISLKLEGEKKSLDIPSVPLGAKSPLLRATGIDIQPQEERNSLVSIVNINEIFTYSEELQRHKSMEKSRNCFNLFLCEPFKNSSLNLLQHCFFLCFGVLAPRHAESQLPDQGSNLHPLHWKVKC